MDISPEEALALINGYRKVPEQYVADVYGHDLWDTQQEILKSVFTYRETAVATCNAIGKSFVAADIAHAFLDLIPGSIVVTTAPTWRQVKDILWRNFAMTHSKAKYPLGGSLSQTAFEYDKDWYAVGLSTKYPENFFGYHADYILVIVDEAGGVPEPIFKGVKAITPNVNARVLYIGNPTDPSGTFHEVFKKPTVKKFKISAFDTPNFKHVGIKNVDDLLKVFTPPAGVDPLEHNPFKDLTYPYPALISPEVVYERYQEWGVDSPAWQALVMGEFPSQAENALIPMNLIMQAMSGLDRLDPESGKSYAELTGWNIRDGKAENGLDMARFGGDNTVLTPGRGDWIDPQISWNGSDNVQSAQKVITIINPFDEQEIKIDDTGTGGGATDALNHLKREQAKTGNPYRFKVIPYNMSQSPADKEKFHDITSEMYWQLREKFLQKKIAFTFKDEELLGELTSRQWSLTPQGKIKVESKKEYIKRTGRKSPDKADSLALKNYTRSDVGSWSDIPEKDKQTAAETRPVTADLMQRY
jgi:phage terminase large subunit